MSIDRILDAIKAVQDLVEDEKEHLTNGEYLDFCNSLQKVYNRARAVKKSNSSDNENDTSDEDENEGEEEEVQIVHTPRGPYYVSADGSMRRVVFPEVPDEEAEEDEDEDEDEEEEEPVERTEADMEINELSELWEENVSHGTAISAMNMFGDLIETILMDSEEKRVGAAVRVINRIARNIKLDDPADAEKLLQWKERLVEEGGIRACAEILSGDHEFEDTEDEPSLYPIICDEIMDLLLCLADDDALYRTKMRRNGVLKAVKAYVKEHPSNVTAQDLLRELS